MDYKNFEFQEATWERYDLYKAKGIPVLDTFSLIINLSRIMVLLLLLMIKVMMMKMMMMMMIMMMMMMLLLVRRIEVMIIVHIEYFVKNNSFSDDTNRHIDGYGSPKNAGHCLLILHNYGLQDKNRELLDIFKFNDIRISDPSYLFATILILATIFTTLMIMLMFMMIMMMKVMMLNILMKLV